MQPIVDRLDQVAGILGAFAKAMEEHMALVKSLQEVARSLQTGFDALNSRIHGGRGLKLLRI